LKVRVLQGVLNGSQNAKREKQELVVIEVLTRASIYFGGLAQLEEHGVCNAEVRGSSPLSSTMTPKEIVIKFVKDRGANTSERGSSPNDNEVCYASKSMFVGKSGRMAVLINMLIGHYSCHCNDRYGNKLTLGYEDPQFFDMLEALLETGECKSSKA
jgi:hypothetical protein